MNKIKKILCVFILLFVINNVYALVDVNVNVKYGNEDISFVLDDSKKISDINDYIETNKSIDTDNQIIKSMGNVILSGNDNINTYILYNVDTSEYDLSLTLYEIKTDEEVLNINSIKPSNENQVYTIFYYFNLDYNIEKVSSTLDKIEAYHDKYYYKNIKLNYNYNLDTYNKISEYTKKITQNKYNLKDFELINLWVNGNKVDDMLSYSGDFKEIIDNKNLVSKMFAGSSYILFSENYGAAVLSFNGTIYYINDSIEVHYNNILYVSDDSTNPKEDIEKRISDYTKKDITVYEDITFSEYYDTLVNNNESEIISKISLFNPVEDRIYYIMVNDIKYYFIIEKDSSKMLTPVYNSVDVLSNISVNSIDSSIPLDTTISVNSVDKDTITAINAVINEDITESFSITLYSNSIENYITKLSDGTFEVRIPISEKFEGKELTVYYITSDNKKEEHKVTVVDGYATFITNHFSIYTLVGYDKIENPNTSDGINIYFMILGLSIILLCVLKNKVRFN